MPLISVIMPLYNAAATVRQSLDAVLQQSLEDLELIVVNDGSTDDSLTLVAAISDPRLRVLSFPNAGAAIARNRGLAVATGDYVAFIDADDLWTADKLAEQYLALKQHPAAGLAYSWTTYISQSGQPICPGKPARFQSQPEVYAQLLIHNFLESGSNPLIRRAVLTEIGGWDESLRSSQDRDLYLRIAERYPFVVVPHYQILYRMTANSISANIVRQEEQNLVFLERAFARAPESMQHLKQKSLAHLYRYLTLRGLEGPMTRQRSWQVARCLRYAMQYDPTLIQRDRRLVIVLWLKILAGLVFPPMLRLTQKGE